MKKVKVLDKVVMFQQLPQGGIEVNMRATIEQYILFGDQETFEFVSERSEADIIPMIINDACWRGNEVSSDWFNMCSKLFNKKQIALNISFIFHIDELQTWRHHLELYSTKFNSDSSPFKKVVNLHNDTMLRDDPNRTENFIYTDFLFNRSHTVHFDNHLVKANWNDVTAKNHWWRSANDLSLIHI